MKTLVMLFTLIMGALVQAFFPAWTIMGQSKPPFILAVVLYYAFVHSRSVMLQAAVVGGFLHDALSMMPLGYSSFVFCVLGLLVRHFRDLVFIHESITHMIFGALTNTCLALALYVLLAKDHFVTVSAGYTFLKLMGACVFGAIIVPIVFRMVAATDQMVGIQQVGES